MTRDSSTKRKSKEIDSTDSIDSEPPRERSKSTVIETEKDQVEKSPSQEEIIQDASNSGETDKVDEANEDISDLPSTNKKRTEIDTDHAESLRRKRDREGSLEPVLTPSQKEIPAKKNRLQSDVEDTEEQVIGSAPSSPTRQTNIEAEKVGQIRKRVEDLSWKQRKEGNRDGEEDEENELKSQIESNEEKKEIEKVGEAEEEKKEKVKSDESQKTPVKKSTQPTFSSFSSASGFAAAAKPKKDNTGGSIFDQETDEKEVSKTPPPLPARTQPTFSSFSKSSSPFNSATASIAGPSWLAGKSSGSIGGGLKPSSLGSVAGSSSNTSHSIAEKSTTLSPKATSSTISSGKGLGFGAFASANPFLPKPSSRTGSPAIGSEKNSNGATGESVAASTPKSDTKEESEKEEGSSFDEALRHRGTKEEEGLSSNVKQKVETQLDKGQADLRTGEEDEFAIASVRAKLFTMADDQSWKERGTGTVRCNIPKSSNGRTTGTGGARLVMRSEGVLRLILNIKLFKGIKINLEQDKFLRIVAFEDGKPAHFALRIGNPTAASQFYYAIRDQIPTTNESESITATTTADELA